MTEQIHSRRAKGALKESNWIVLDQSPYKAIGGLRFKPVEHQCRTNGAAGAGMRGSRSLMAAVWIQKN